MQCDTHQKCNTKGTSINVADPIVVARICLDDTVVLDDNGIADDKKSICITGSDVFTCELGQKCQVSGSVEDEACLGSD